MLQYRHDQAPAPMSPDAFARARYAHLTEASRSVAAEVLEMLKPFLRRRLEDALVHEAAAIRGRAAFRSIFGATAHVRSIETAGAMARLHTQEAAVVRGRLRLVQLGDAIDRARAAR